MKNLMLALVAVGGLSSCIGISTHYEHMLPYTLSPRDNALAYEGSATMYFELTHQAQELHLFDSEKRRLTKRAFASIPRQIGSEDYYITGYIRSKGAGAPVTDLQERMLIRGAKEGGDVVFFFDPGQHAMAEGFVLRYEPGHADRADRFDAVFSTEAGRADIIKELAPNDANRLPTHEEYFSKLISIMEHHEKVNPELQVPD